MALFTCRTRVVPALLSLPLWLFATSADLAAQGYRRDDPTAGGAREAAIEDRIRSLEWRVQQLESLLRQQASGGSGRLSSDLPVKAHHFDASKNSRFDGLPELTATDAGATGRSIRERLGAKSIYVSYGPVSGPGNVVQIDAAGQVLGHVTTPGSLLGINIERDRMRGVHATARIGDGQVLAIDAAGKLEAVFRSTALLSDTIAMSSNPQCDYYLVGDNGADRVVQISKSGSEPPFVRFQQERSANFQSMSIAACGDGSLLYWSNDVDGIYRLAAGESDLPDRPQVYAESRFGNAVAASPVSNKWAALLESRLVLFDGEKPVSVIGYPAGEHLFHGLACFVGDGLITVAFQSGNVWGIDLANGEALKLFNVSSNRTIGMTVGEPMDWPAADSAIARVVVATQ